MARVLTDEEGALERPKLLELQTTIREFCQAHPTAKYVRDPDLIAAAKAGPDDSSPTSCSYVRGHLRELDQQLSPGCVVGYGLRALGTPDEVLAGFDPVFGPNGRVHAQAADGATALALFKRDWADTHTKEYDEPNNDIWEWLSTLQCWQDNGETLGEALGAAERSADDATRMAERVRAMKQQHAEHARSMTDHE